MNNSGFIRFLILGLFLAVPPAVSAEPAGEVRTLSADRMAGLMRGAGMGYAKAADLNGWPGPLHALEMRDALGLSEAQVRAMTSLRQEMADRAVPLGRALIEAERALNRLFAAGAPSPAAVEAAVARIAEIEGRLRAVHLVTHLRAAPLLTRHQTMLYNRARHGGAAEHGGHSHGG